MHIVFIDAAYQSINQSVAIVAYFVDRYVGFDAPDIPKFHYGSHYSSAGTVLFYCIRLEVRLAPPRVTVRSFILLSD